MLPKPVATSLCVLLTSALALACGPVGLAADSAGPTLRVRPVLCIANRNSEQCATTFQIDWSSPVSGNFCVASDNQREPLRCWTQAVAGGHRDRLVVTKDFTYWLASADSQQKLRSVKVELLRLHSDDRRRERRSRHVWDIL
jgi:hypothetical protein